MAGKYASTGVQTDPEVSAGLANLNHFPFRLWTLSQALCLGQRMQTMSTVLTQPCGS
jgi:hypothetical protein